MDQRDVTSVASFFIEAFGRAYRAFYRRRDPRAHRPSAETIAMLEHLASTGPLTVTETARHFDRSQAATSELLERLLKRGLLDRIADERDRRRHLVWLSLEGRAVLEEERSVLSAELVERAVAEMSPADRAHLVQGLRALEDAVERSRRTIINRKRKGESP